jgi:uncharacterized protein YidB (DUF937 family)
VASGSMKALLAVLAVAGYQNRDKLAELLKKATERSDGLGQPTPQATGQSMGQPDTGSTGMGGAGGAASSQASGGLDDILDRLGGGLGGLLGSGGLGSVLGGGRTDAVFTSGLNDVLDQFRQAGQGGKADSWVGTGVNDPIDDSELQQALGPDVLRDVAAKIGLSEEEVLRRLSKNLPDAVDGLTPDGQVPPVQGTA